MGLFFKCSAFLYKYSKIILKKLTNPNKNPPITIVPKWYLNNLKALSGIGLKCSYPLSPYCQYQIDTTPDMIKLFPAIRIEKTQNIPNNKYMLISFWMRLNPIDPKALFSSGYPVEYNIIPSWMKKTNSIILKTKDIKGTTTIYWL